MRDPHIHVEKTLVPEFGHAAMAEHITQVTGLTPPLPKTTATGCGKRRPLTMTSFVPEMVTCLACREYARDLYLSSVKMTEALLASCVDDRVMLPPGCSTLSELGQRAEAERLMAARYAS